MKALSPGEVRHYLADCRACALEELARILPSGGPLDPVLYDLMRDYPLRAAKGLRPALAIATCAALGGTQDAVLPSAATLELFHNAFLIHDDIEDGSLQRRDAPTLHRQHGVPIAINVGDSMLALALEPLLGNMALLGMGRALRILQIVSTMTRITAEGQAVELDWIRSHRWDLADRDYIRMVYQKTGWYSFVAPILMGAVAAGAPVEQARALARVGMLLGVAFQIQDDLLNLTGEAHTYGKEIAGDLWEGKHTLVLIHALRHAPATERAAALAILSRPRPSLLGGQWAAISAEITALEAAGTIPRAAAASLRRAATGGSGVKTATEIVWLQGLIERQGSINYARGVASDHAAAAVRRLEATATEIEDSTHRRFLRGLI
jgi:geranylgeranyl diphosphate synthase type II